MSITGEREPGPWSLRHPSVDFQGASGRGRKARTGVTPVKCSSQRPGQLQGGEELKSAPVLEQDLLMK